jgi:hypothetical protein
MSEGLLGEVFKNLAVLGLKPAPQQIPNTFTLEWTEDEFKKYLLSNVDVKVQNAIDVKIVQGKIVITIKLM